MPINHRGSNFKARKCPSLLEATKNYRLLQKLTRMSAITRIYFGRLDEDGNQGICCRFFCCQMWLLLVHVDSKTPSRNNQFQSQSH
jgi:hypothetical protein